MKRLIVCCDGTWNNPEQEENGIPAPTNVYKIYNAIEESSVGGVEQLKYYHPGVGGEGGLVDSVLGGALGIGINRHIQSAYHWIGSNYEEDDEIYLFGFSRGAFTARSVGGLLARGLLNLKTLAPEESWKRVEKAYQKGYRKDAKREDWAGSDWAFFHKGPAPIHFIGVWDTVGSLGIPDDLEILNIFDDKKKWQFHNTDLGENVKHARHAMALDEMRSSFSLTRWSNAKTHPDVKEIWFPGAHSDVGGGYSICELSNGALLWMMDESHDVGLEFRDGIRETIHANPLGVMHNSFKGIFSKLRSRPRNIDAMISENKALFHKNAFDRQKTSPISYSAYHPTKVLEVDESVIVDVYADTRWNYTGLYLEKGHKYIFSATGEWQDSKDTCDWKGTQNDEFTFGDIARSTASFLGKFEKIFKKFTKNQSTDFIGTKRVEEFNWFTLVGAISNDSGSKNVVKNDGSPTPHQYVELAAHEADPLEIEKPGYLYCFPNDVWSLYGNNNGSVQLKIQRVA